VKISLASGALARYGALGMPLAFVALPLHVHWASVAATQWALPLEVVGTMLLAVRALDALVDPWLGRVSDRVLASQRAWAVIAFAVAWVVVGFAILFSPPPPAVLLSKPLTILWATIALLLTYLGYSIAQILHQSWGARWGGDAPQRARIVAWREGFALLGVVVASVLPTLLAWPVISALLLALAVVAVAALWRVPTPETHTSGDDGVRAASFSVVSPWRSAAFRQLISVYVLSGLAAAIPATLVIFFIRDRLQANAWEAAFLFAYFAAAALSLPRWTRLVSRWGLVRCWSASMLLAILSFGGAAWLGAGDGVYFIFVCIGSGVALGAELIAPGALLAGLLQREGSQRQNASGLWFGWWTFATKFNLALAAGVALPLVALWGYAPGGTAPAALNALAWVYGALPCLIKLLAFTLLRIFGPSWNAPHREPPPQPPSTSRFNTP